MFFRIFSIFVVSCENHIVALLVIRHAHILGAASAILRVGYCYDERTEFILDWRRMLVIETGTFSMI